MSSILDALHQLESSDAPPETAPEVGPERPSRLPLIAGGLALAFTAGVGLSLVIRHERTPAKPSGRAVVSPRARAPLSATPVNASRVLPVVPALPPLLVLANAETPWARLATPDPASAVPAPRARPALAVERPTLEGETRSGAVASSSGAAGEPYVRLAALGYSPSPDRRTASLVVNGGSPVTLREGQSASEVQVTLILPDRVYLRHAGQIFAVHSGE